MTDVAVRHRPLDQHRPPEPRAAADLPLPRSPEIRVRPLEPSDADGILEFGCHLSMETRYRRFFSPLRSLSTPLLTRLVTMDHRDREALAATVDEEIVAVARYDRSLTEPDTAEIAVVVADDWHRHGLGRRLLLELSALAAERGIRAFTATTLLDNKPVEQLLHQLWPGVHGRYSEGTYLYRLPLPTLEAATTLAAAS